MSESHLYFIRIIRREPSLVRVFASVRIFGTEYYGPLRIPGKVEIDKVNLLLWTYGQELLNRKTGERERNFFVKVVS